MTTPPPPLNSDDLLSSTSVEAAGDRRDMTELASGIDGLYLSGRCALPHGLAHRLAEAKSEALASRGGHFTFGAEEFRFGPSGFGRHSYRLEHQNGLIGLSASKSLPAVKVQIRASFLHAVGPTKAVEWFDQVIANEVGSIVWTVSRVDLFSDWQGWSLCAADLNRFVCRARNRATYEANEEFNGVVFGKRTTNTVMARIYDKTIEMAAKGGDYWREVWGDRLDPSRHVLRVEFQIGRDGLREYGLDAPGQVIANAGTLWASVTEEWLTYRTLSDDQTKSRRPISPEWQAVQRAQLRHDAIGIARVRAWQRRGSLRLLMPTLFGALVSFAAIEGYLEIPDTLAWLHFQMRQYERENDLLFSNRAFGRRLELDLLEES